MLWCAYRVGPSVSLSVHCLCPHPDETLSPFSDDEDTMERNVEKERLVHVQVEDSDPPEQTSLVKSPVLFACSSGLSELSNVRTYQ